MGLDTTAGDDVINLISTTISDGADLHAIRATHPFRSLWAGRTGAPPAHRANRGAEIRVTPLTSVIEVGPGRGVPTSPEGGRPARLVRKAFSGFERC
jgi:hypothetical protein